MEGTASNEEFIKFLDIFLEDLLPLVYWCELSMRRALNDGDTYFVFSFSFILSHVSIGG